MKRTALLLLAIFCVLSSFAQIKSANRSHKKIVGSKSIAVDKGLSLTLPEPMKERLEWIKTKGDSMLDAARYASFLKKKIAIKFEARSTKKSIDSAYADSISSLLNIYKIPAVIGASDGQLKLETFQAKSEHFHRVNDSLDDFIEELKDQQLIAAYRLSTQIHSIQFFPAKNRRIAALYYDENGDKAVQSLQNAFLSFSPYGGQIYSEFVSGYGGPCRISFGGMVSSSNVKKLDSTTLVATEMNKIDSVVRSIDSINRRNNSIQNLLAGGGNAMVIVSTPVFNYHPGSAFELSGTVFDKNCFTIPALNTHISDYSYLNGLGGQINVQALFEGASITNFGVYGIVSGTFLYGNKTFYKNIGLVEQKVLFYRELQFGLIIDRFRIYYSHNHVSDESLQSQIQNVIGVSLVPFGK